MDHHQQQEQQEEWSSTATGGGVPPGFRFHPTEEELVGYYLARKVLASSSSSPRPQQQQQIDLLLDDIIQEVDLYRIEPWDLQGRMHAARLCSNNKHMMMNAGEQEWYFFSYKDRKYPSGTRTNRATAAGFWKATGRDKPVLSSTTRGRGGGVVIGMRKTLVFYRGRAPNGSKTEWIMHEYRLTTQCDHAAAAAAQEEGWVVCRAFHKPIPNHHHHQSRPPPFNYYYPYATPPPAGYHDLLGSSRGSNIIGGAGFSSADDDDDLQFESKINKHRLCFSSILPQLESPTSAVVAPTISYQPAENDDDDQLMILQQQQQQGQLAAADAIDWSFLDTLLQATTTTSHQLHHDDDYPIPFN